MSEINFIWGYDDDIQHIEYQNIKLNMICES